MSAAWKIRVAPRQDHTSPECIENLYLTRDNPIPEPGPNTARVRLHAAALNGRDMMVIAHSPGYPWIADTDIVPVADGAGIVDAVGPGSKWSVGDKVLLTPMSWIEGDFPDWATLKTLGSGSTDGTLRQHAVFDDSLLIRAPARLPFEDCAALPAIGGTAVQALYHGPLPLRGGMTIVTQGTGGVSTAAIQIASAAGATVIATSSSTEKLQIAKKLGAAHLINYKDTPDWSDQVRRLTGGKGADHILNVGGSATILQSLKAIRRGGLISMIGMLGNDEPVSIMGALLASGALIRAFGGFRRDMVEDAVALFDKHQLRPAIGKVVEFENAKEAFKAMQNGAEVGKIVIKVA